MKSTKTSKKRLLIWLGCIGVGMLFSLGKYTYQRYREEAIGSSNLTVPFLQALQQNSTDFVLFTIGHRDCSVCKDISNKWIKRKIDASCYYFDVTTHPHNRLLSQALCTKYFPTTYIFDGRMNLLGIVLGNRDREKKVLKTCLDQKNYASVKVEKVEDSNLQELLSYSLQALFSGVRQDINNLEKYAKKSLEKGEYFFNHYLMYKVFLEKQMPDSIQKYREQTLRYAKYGNQILYQDLIDSLNIR